MQYYIYLHVKSLHNRAHLYYTYKFIYFAVNNNGGRDKFAPRAVVSKSVIYNQTPAAYFCREMRLYIYTMPYLFSALAREIETCKLHYRISISPSPGLDQRRRRRSANNPHLHIRRSQQQQQQIISALPRGEH